MHVVLRRHVPVLLLLVGFLVSSLHAGDARANPSDLERIILEHLKRLEPPTKPRKLNPDPQADLRNRAARVGDSHFVTRISTVEVLYADRSRLLDDLRTANISLERFLDMYEGVKERTMDVLGRTHDKRNVEHRVPLAFPDPELFTTFSRELAALLNSDDLKNQVNRYLQQPQVETVNAMVLQLGTATSFYSHNPKKPVGHHFDREGPSDLDLKIYSTELTQAMLKDLGHALRAGTKGQPTDDNIPIWLAANLAQAVDSVGINVNLTDGAVYHVFRSGDWTDPRSNTFYGKFPQFAELARKWSGILGREVEIKLEMTYDIPRFVPMAGGPILLYQNAEYQDVPGGPLVRRQFAWPSFADAADNTEDDHHIINNYLGNSIGMD